MNTLTAELRDKLFPYGNLILCGYRGSIAQNTYVPNTNPNSIDDIDVMGIYLAPVEYYLGFERTRRFTKGKDIFVDEWDATSYELKHFVSLLMKANPNVLSLLWIKEKHYIPVENPTLQRWGRIFVDNRDLFTAKTAYKSFTGYAYGQLKRMTHHVHKGYMGEKRKALVKKFGYDTKNASHLIRLLKMGIEFLNNGKLRIFREEDSDLLKEIKTGKWKLEDVQKKSMHLFEEAKKAKDKSSLPEKPDIEKVRELITSINKEYICEGYE